MFLNTVLGKYVLIINVIIVGHLSSLSIKDFRGLTHDFEKAVINAHPKGKCMREFWL
jgi:hypothetical protein